MVGRQIPIFTQIRVKIILESEEYDGAREVLLGGFDFAR